MDDREHVIEITGLETFRRVVCISSLIFAAISGIILAIGPSPCTFTDYDDAGNIISETTYNLDNGIWAVGCTNATIFFMLILHYIHCGSCIKAVGRGMVLYYVLMIGTMVYAQMVFFGGNGCGTKAFFLYYWLATNIVLFYIFIAYGISLWGAYLCWAQEEEENIV